jgi:glycosyltransferase involved in cell wall biosynthesis
MTPLVQILTLMSGDGPTGVETHFNQLRTVLNAQGFETGLISPWVERTWMRRLPNPFLRRIHVVMPERVHHWGLVLDRRDLVGKLERLAAIHSNQPLVALAQDPNSALAALQVARRNPIKVVLTIHFSVSEAREMMDKGLIRPDGLMWRKTFATEETVLRGVDRVVFVSDFMRREVMERYPWLPSSKISVIHNSCTDSGAQISVKQGEVQADILAIGTLEPRKNQAYLIRILAFCKSLGHNYTLTFAGNGPERQSLVALTHELGVSDQVRFLGHMPDAARLLASHRVLAHAAIMENLPIVIVEALAAGRPILTPAVGGIPEIISDGVQGRFWPLDDPTRAARQLIQILEDPVATEAMSLAARRRYVEHFTPGRFAAEWHRLIDDLAQGYSR